MYKSEWRRTINIWTLLHFHILFFIMHCTFAKELTHSLMTSHDKHAFTLVKRLAYLSLHNDTLAHSWTYICTNIVLRTMTYQVCKHAWIYMRTDLDISPMLCTFTFHTYTFVHTPSYCIHTQTQIHLIIRSMFATWSVIVILFL